MDTWSSYSVVYTLNGCVSLPSSSNVIVNSIPSVTLPNIDLCYGDSAFLTAIPSDPGGYFTWTPGGLGPQSIIVNEQNSTQNQVVYTLNGCTSLSATVSLPEPISPTIPISIY